MIRRLLAGVALALFAAVPVSAQLFGVVFDPTNYSNAVLRYAQLQQQYSQLVQTYSQLRTHYQLFLAQTQRLPFSQALRYRIVPSLWRVLTAPDVYHTTTGWIRAANTGLDV